MQRVGNAKAASACALALVLFLLWSAAAAAQEQLARLDRGPRFMQPAAGTGAPEEVDVTQVALLRRRVSLNREGATVAQLLQEISRQTGLRFAYNADVLAVDRVVGLRADSITLAAALTEILVDAGVDVLLKSSRQAVLLRRSVSSLVGTVAGRVTDSTTGAPVVGAGVYLEGTRWRTATAEDGGFRLEQVSPGSYTLLVRRIGYAPSRQVVTVGDDETVEVTIALTRQATMLDAVVTTVTGDQRRLEVGNVIGTVAADSLVRSGSINTLSDLLVARVPGVQVILPDGFTGSAPSVRVRGINSLSLSNDPLLVVDGVRVANTTAKQFASSVLAGFGMTGGRFNDLDPDEIESIDIVKGPSAATLYGTDAANGVIVVKTKRGTNGAPQWTASGEFGAFEPAVRFLDNYYSWGHTPAGVVQQCTLDRAAAGTCTIDSLTKFNALTDPATSPIGTGLRQSYGLQVRGGLNNVTYFLSAARDYERGYLRMPDAEQARIRAERGGAAIPDEQIHPNWISNVRLRGNVGVRFGPKLDVTLATGLVFNETSIPWFDIFLSGEWGKGYRDANDGWGTDGRPGEIFALRNRENVAHFTGSLAAHWRPLNWLATRATVGVDFSNDFLDALQRRNEGRFTTRAGRRQNTRSSLDLRSVDLSASATFTPRDGLTSRTSVGVQYNRTNDKYTSVTATGLAPGSETIAGATTITGAEQNLESVVAGGYLEQTFGWRDRLYLTGALRADGASSFGRAFKTATYPKVSASWLAVPTRVGWMNSLRFRSAYGASGVQPGSTAALTLNQLVTVFTDGSTASGAIPSTIGNPSLKPERTAEIEAGLEGSLLSERLSLELTYYHRRSRDALVQYPLPWEVAVPFQWRNIAAVLNYGVEGQVTLTVLNRPALAWDLSLNGSVNTGRIERVGFPVPLTGGTPMPVSNVAGYAPFSRFGRPIVSYGDANGNGIIEASEITVGATPVYVGPGVPRRQLTTTVGVSLLRRRVRVSSQFDYRGDFVTVNLHEAVGCLAGIASCRAVNDPTASFFDQARAVAYATPSLGRTWWGFYEDASFMRWRELSISAEIPSWLVSHLKAKTAIVSLAARNLALFTKYSGSDPEVNASAGFSSGREQFSDNPTAPQSRYWLFRLHLEF